ncbi:MAG: cysteine--tRNA ligase [Nitrospirae bacterium]|nr:cysteine--tRNA ligase [Nitrospirota bacterium]
MKIYNTLTGCKEEFIPILPDKVRIYACGVTVYDYCHIGHARSAIIFDVIRRYLQYKGYDVKYVRNFTDIDDKIINKAIREKVSWDVIAAKYTDEYYADMDKLGVGRADIEPKATEHIPEMIAIVKSLIEKGYAYEIDGNVFFSVEKFPEYGKLSKRDIKELMAGARVDVDENKRNPMDFALWKKSKEGEPAWESPWGLGRPGWHIECTAMSIKHLGETFDIHGGGADLLFPHHENEIAQSEAYTGKPFAKYWVHNGFITVDREKMSKSLGNFFTIKEILNKFDPEVLRLFLLSTHYRSPIEFSDEQLREIETSLDRYYATVVRINDILEKDGYDREGLSTDVEKYSNFLYKFRENFEEAMDDDFNTAFAIGCIFELIRELNRFLDSRPSGRETKKLLKETKAQLSEAGKILNIFNKTPYEWYLSLMKIKKIEFSERDIIEKIKLRQEARKRKDWKLADTIRREFEMKGIILEDKKDRTDWKVKIG